MSSLLLLTLGQEYVEAQDASGFQPLGDLVHAVREWTDALGPALVFSLSALILYSLLYQSRLVPAWLSVWGLVGAVLLLVAGVLALFGETSTSATSIALTAPIGINEMVLAVWLIVKGFNTSALAPELEGKPALT